MARKRKPDERPDGSINLDELASSFLPNHPKGSVSSDGDPIPDYSPEMGSIDSGPIIRKSERATLMVRKDLAELVSDVAGLSGKSIPDFLDESPLRGWVLEKIMQTIAEVIDDTVIEYLEYRKNDPKNSPEQAEEVRKLYEATVADAEKMKRAKKQSN